jgi:hypothetical protein
MQGTINTQRRLDKVDHELGWHMPKDSLTAKKAMEHQIEQ